ncbi:MAG: hypothetical protein V2I57_09455 [Xanthomonadales bacterium]|nr:hypothetical protein [Xanthomonadales bacterium]
MKTKLAAMAIILVATSAHAEHYGALEGNPDLGPQHQTPDSPINVAARASGGDKFDLHHGLSNPDLSPPPATSDPNAPSGTGSSIDFHHGLDNPDLSPPPAQ